VIQCDGTSLISSYGESGVHTVSNTGTPTNDTCNRCIHTANGRQIGNHTSQKTCGIDSKTPTRIPPSRASTGAWRGSTPANHPRRQKKIPWRLGHLYIFRFSNSDRNKRWFNNGFGICVLTGAPQKISSCESQGREF